MNCMFKIDQLNIIKEIILCLTNGFHSSMLKIQDLTTQHYHENKTTGFYYYYFLLHVLVLLLCQNIIPCTFTCFGTTSVPNHDTTYFTCFGTTLDQNMIPLLTSQVASKLVNHLDDLGGIACAIPRVY